MKIEQVEDLADMVKTFLSFSNECLKNNVIDEETYTSITNSKIKFLEEIQAKQG